MGGGIGYLYANVDAVAGIETPPYDSRPHNTCETTAYRCLLTHCGHYASNDYSSRCKSTSVVWLITDEGGVCPGGGMCAMHAARCVAEYREKLGEQWAVRGMPGATEAEVAHAVRLARMTYAELLMLAE